MENSLSQSSRWDSPCLEESQLLEEVGMLTTKISHVCGENASHTLRSHPQQLDSREAAHFLQYHSSPRARSYIPTAEHNTSFHSSKQHELNQRTSYKRSIASQNAKQEEHLVVDKYGSMKLTYSEYISILAQREMLAAGTISPKTNYRSSLKM